MKKFKMLNFGETSAKALNEKLKKSNARNTYKLVLNANSKALVLNASAVKVLKSEGLQDISTYISSKKEGFEDLYRVLKLNPEIFTDMTK